MQDDARCLLLRDIADNVYSRARPSERHCKDVIDIDYQTDVNGKIGSDSCRYEAHWTS